MARHRPARAGTLRSGALVARRHRFAARRAARIASTPRASSICSCAPTNADESVYAALAATTGTAKLTIVDSLLAGIALQGSGELRQQRRPRPTVGRRRRRRQPRPARRNDGGARREQRRLARRRSTRLASTRSRRCSRRLLRRPVPGAPRRRWSGSLVARGASRRPLAARQQRRRAARQGACACGPSRSARPAPAGAWAAATIAPSTAMLVARRRRRRRARARSHPGRRLREPRARIAPSCASPRRCCRRRGPTRCWRGRRARRRAAVAGIVAPASPSDRRIARAIALVVDAATVATPRRLAQRRHARRARAASSTSTAAAPAAGAAALREVVARSTRDADARPGSRRATCAAAFVWAGAPLRVSPRARHAPRSLGADLALEPIAWQQGAARAPRHGSMRRQTVDAIAVAPILRGAAARLRLGRRPARGRAPEGAQRGRASASTWSSSAASGDLTVTDEISTQSPRPLGPSPRHRRRQAASGISPPRPRARRSASSRRAATARTSPGATWPAADDAARRRRRAARRQPRHLGPVARARLAPRRPRCTRARASAAASARRSTPATSKARGVTVRNFIEGVNVTDGTVAIALQRHHARDIETFTAKGGAGTLQARRRRRLRRSADGAAAPGARSLRAARLASTAASSRPATRRCASTPGRSALDGDLQGRRRPGRLHPLRRADARRRRRGRAPAEAAPAAVPAALAQAQAPAPVVGAPQRDGPRSTFASAWASKLRVRGRGLDAGLRGELRLTSPSGRLAVNGTLRAVDGTYQAYGQKLDIDRGVLSFVGPGREPAPRHRGDAARTSTFASAWRSPAPRSIRASACSPSPSFPTSTS